MKSVYQNHYNESVSKAILFLITVESSAVFDFVWLLLCSCNDFLSKVRLDLLCICTQPHARLSLLPLV